MKADLRRLLPEIVFLVLIVSVFWLYSLGFGAGFQFDDLPNIRGVKGVHDWTSAMIYLFDGKAGPVGRPVSFATFLLQKESWPDSPADFFLFNTIIHIANGLLVYCLANKLLSWFPSYCTRRSWMALTLGAMWLSTPLLASTSLMAVQRMTSMSATFMLLGLLGFLYGRSVLRDSPAKAYWLMSVSVVVGTFLALLCKENGVLLPGYVLLLELMLIRHVNSTPNTNFRKWQLAFLWLPVAMVAAYFAYQWQAWVAAYAIRDFTLHERLLTEARVLWDYLGQIFIPARNGTGPYHDDYLVSKGLLSPLTTLLAIGAWLGLLGYVWKTRRSLTWLSFGVMWFLVGHAMESSFLPLELYFEHRNYFPSIGPLLAATVMVWNVPVKVFRVVMLGVVMMVVLRLFVLGETTHSWGQPLLSAKLWVDEHPLSPRAAQHLTRVYFYAGDELASLQATLDGHERIKKDAGLALQSVYLSCLRDDEATFHQRIQNISPALASGTGANATPELLVKILDAQQQGGCRYMQLDQLLQLTDLLINNPHLKAVPGVLAGVHVFRYRLYAFQGKPNSSIRELVTAFTAHQESQIAAAAARVMASNGHSQEALAFLDRASRFKPHNPFLQVLWLKDIDDTRNAINEGIKALQTN